MNITQMIIISTTVGRNPLEEIEPSSSTKESEMQYLDAVSKMTTLFVFKANHSISQ